MNIAFLLGLLLGMIAALMLNIGKGVQKRHVHVFLQGRRLFHRRNRRRLLAWLVGLAMTGGASLPFSLGLMLSGSPSTISAMTGVGLIGLVIYAVRVIGEPIGRQDILGIGLVVAATSALGYLGAGKAATVREFADLRLIQVFAVLIAPAAAACVAALRFRRIHGVAFGVTSGMFIGLALFLADAALVRAGGLLLRSVRHPLPVYRLALRRGGGNPHPGRLPPEPGPRSGARRQLRPHHHAPRPGGGDLRGPPPGGDNGVHRRHHRRRRPAVDRRHGEGFCVIRQDDIEGNHEFRETREKERMGP